jgi:hypothetical protein
MAVEQCCECGGSGRYADGSPCEWCDGFGEVEVDGE